MSSQALIDALGRIAREARDKDQTSDGGDSFAARIEALCNEAISEAVGLEPKPLACFGDFCSGGCA